jgi:hypothetical protein
MTPRKNPIGITAAPDHVVYAMREALANNPDGTGLVWPFRYMRVGDEVTFSGKAGSYAQTRGHVYAQSTKAKLFGSRRDDEGRMRIWRKEDATPDMVGRGAGWRRAV